MRMGHFVKNQWLNENRGIYVRCFDVHSTHFGRWRKCIGLINSPPPGQNGSHFADDIFRCIFVNETFHILIWISLGLIDNVSALAQVMAWRLTNDKPLSEPIMA